MITLRHTQERGQADHGWLKSQHSFSFAGYYDPEHMGWGNLRVINEDRLAAGAGFGTHGHQDMEIISYVLSGALAHQDDMGNGTTIPAGDVQRMSAGSGVRHSEFNKLDDQATHFFQIWILPNVQGIKPGYEQKTFDVQAGSMQLIASPDGDNGSVTIHADALLYRGFFNDADQVSLALSPKRKAYLHLVRGEIRVNDLTLQAGDAVLVANESMLNLSGAENAEVLFFDLAA
ncbi:pirin family protein [Solimicrobium silvestre]|uniref:Pirin-related protein n=1 Tax=Solimicrobium silvestre TaxID=2099400 RepID=A0A2S9GSP4_9BURK|nr:pirin family protein [Solimicrobium silvestre]PRC90737.1 Pirin-related protein [Solimicrobium silvestre]